MEIIIFVEVQAWKVVASMETFVDFSRYHGSVKFWWKVKRGSSHGSRGNFLGKVLPRASMEVAEVSVASITYQDFMEASIKCYPVCWQCQYRGTAVDVDL